MTNLTAALKYAAAGWPVMPLAGVRGIGSCSCWARETCKSIGKHPRTLKGLYDATTDQHTIESWWAQWPEANIGIRTGILFDVLDVDGEIGEQSLATLTTLDAWPGAIAKTGNGYHLYVKPTGYGNTAHALPGLDFRGDGGYVVVPPSIHGTGSRYEWLKRGAPESAPQWLLDLLDPPDACRVQTSAGRCSRRDPHKHRNGVIHDPAQQLIGGLL